MIIVEFFILFLFLLSDFKFINYIYNNNNKKQTICLGLFTTLLFLCLYANSCTLFSLSCDRRQ